MLNTKEGKTKKEIEKCPWIALWIHLSPSYIRTEENDDDMNHKERVGGGHLHCTGWVGGRFAFRSHTACHWMGGRFAFNLSIRHSPPSLL